MASHLWAVKTARPITQTNLRMLYDQGIARGCTEVEAKRLAVQQLESRRQRGGQPCLPAVITAKAKAGLGQHANEYTYDRLMGQPRPDDDGKANLPALKARIKAYDPTLLKRLNAAERNYQNITGIKLSYHDNCQWYSHSFWSVTLPWAKITRARDLFIKGLGSFDLNAVVLYLNAPGRSYKTFIQLGSILAKGYADKFPVLPEWTLNTILTTPQYLNHVMQHRGYYGVTGANKHADWFVTKLRKAFYNCDNNGPDQTVHARMPKNATPHDLHRLYLAYEQYRQDYIDQHRNNRGTNYTPPVRVATFDWLLPVKPLTANGITLTPITTDQQLQSYSKALHNCAAGYNNLIAAKKIAIFVGHDQKGKLILMADIRVGKTGFSQCVGPCNGKLPNDLYLSACSLAIPFAQQIKEALALPAPVAATA